MDPNAALAELRRLVSEHNRDDGQTGPALERLDRMCELIDALDNWVVGGGFLPLEWLTPAGLRMRRAQGTTVWEETHERTSSSWAEKLETAGICSNCGHELERPTAKGPSPTLVETIERTDQDLAVSGERSNSAVWRLAYEELRAAVLAGEK